MNHDQTFFDDDQRPVPSVDFDYDALDGEEAQIERACTGEHTSLLFAGLLLTLDSKAPKTTAAALGVLLKLFPTKAEAARAAHVSRAAMTFAVRQLTKKLCLAAKRPQSTQTPMKTP